MTIDELKAEAVSEWGALQQSDKPQILVGTASCGQEAGALVVLEAIESALARNNIEANITRVGCTGLCYAEPLVDIIKPGHPRISYGNVTPEIASRLIEDYLVNENPRPELALGTIGEGSVEGVPALFGLPVFKSQVRLLMARCGTIDPENIGHYIANGGYSGLAKALEMKPEEVIAEIKNSGLRGRGGFGLPTGLKWESCRNAEGEARYFICNADESHPGSFVDRTLLESDPHSVLEGMLIGAYAVGAADGYIYIHSKHSLAEQRLKVALEQAAEKGLMGDNILGSGFSFNIIIRRGAGAFICGEETALINSIEGKQGTPRFQPPSPVEQGLWGKPTNINNVETLANVPHIIEKTSDWYAGVGTENSKGTKLFSIGENIARAGVFEVPFGLTLKELVEEIGGGLPEGLKLKAIQPAGGMLGLIPASLAETPIDFDSLAEIDSGVGNGGMVIIDESACVVDTAYSLVSFAYNELCGTCSVGRLGTRQMVHILENIVTGKGQPRDIELLTELTETMGSTTLCAFCGSSTAPMRSILRHFREEVEAHIREKRCPANVCQALSGASKSQD
jgi:NADH-quinone oxidoreductase subunit F